MKRIIALILAMVMAVSMVACSTEVKNEVPSVTADVTKEADIVIVGAGAAGLAAAIEAVENGAESVIVIEKTATTGGSLNFTSGSMSGAETIIQQIDGVEDTKESYVQDILNNGANLGNKELIEAFVEEDVAAIQWLWDNGLSDNTFSIDRATGTMSVFAPEHALYSVKRTYKASAHDGAKYKSAAHEILDTVHFGRRATPVLGRKGVEGDILHAVFLGSTKRGADRLHTCNVSLRALLATLLGPSTVAVHDDGNMLRYWFFVLHNRVQI